MTATVSKAGPYYSSGEIKFSSLRSNFVLQDRKQTSGGSEGFITPTGLLRRIRASDLRRDTNTSNTYPNVPDATENSNISTSTNWKISQFRGSVKFYYITQSGTDLNFDIDAQSWNNNLNKNIEKILFVDGTCGSNSTSSSAADFNATAYNLSIDVYGNIYGAGGAGGTLATISGGNGGTALSINSAGGSNIVVYVRNTAKIYGGGGGGEKGFTNSAGTNGTCFNYFYYSVGSGCEWCGSCGGGVQIGGCGGVSGCDCFIWCRKTQLANAQCRGTNYYTVAGGAGGEGGDGGAGRGYNNLSGTLSGNPGFPGAAGSCSGYDGTTTTPGTGNPGGNGGNGGDWASDGVSDGINIGSGGVAGRAISGSNYSVTGSINADTIKGLYQP